MKIRVLSCAASKLAIFFGVLGAVSAIPAAADTLDLSTGTAVYMITANTLNPTQGGIGPAVPVASLGSGWASLASSAWIGPTADQSQPISYSIGNYYVTYQTTFILPGGLDPGSHVSITFLADDWSTVALDGVTFYQGPAGCNPQISDPLYLGSCTSDPTSWLHSTDLLTSALTSGTNTLSFTVWNTGGTTNGVSSDSGGGSTGLDAQVAVNYTSGSPIPAQTPEPPTALTFASSLAIGLAFWRLRVGQQTAC